MDFPPRLVLGRVRAEGQGDVGTPRHRPEQGALLPCSMCLEALPPPMLVSPMTPLAWFSLSPE